MALTKYNAQPPPAIGDYRQWLYAELRKIDVANSAVINLLEAIGDKPINVGAPNSGGAGQRVLTIDN